MGEYFMTPEEALQQLIKNYSSHPQLYSDEYFIAVENALKLLIPAKPIYGDFDDDGSDEETIIPYSAKCPTCGEDFEFGAWNEEENHHCSCGQKIDWEY